MNSLAERILNLSRNRPSIERIIFIMMSARAELIPHG